MVKTMSHQSFVISFHPLLSLSSSLLISSCRRDFLIFQEPGKPAVNITGNNFKDKVRWTRSAECLVRDTICISCRRKTFRKYTKLSGGSFETLTAIFQTTQLVILSLPDILKQEKKIGSSPKPFRLFSLQFPLFYLLKPNRLFASTGAAVLPEQESL